MISSLISSYLHVLPLSLLSASYPIVLPLSSFPHSFSFLNLFLLLFFLFLSLLTHLCLSSPSLPHSLSPTHLFPSLLKPSHYASFIFLMFIIKGRSMRHIGDPIILIRSQCSFCPEIQLEWSGLPWPWLCDPSGNPLSVHHFPSLILCSQHCRISSY